MNELQVQVTQKAGIISFNFDELKENLETMMSAYENATFSEDTIKEARGELATLRKIDKALSDRRIEIKKEFMKPYDDFETRVKELNGLIQEPIQLIDKQVKAFEAKQKAEKKAKIAEIYEKVIGEMAKYLPLEKIYQESWENVSTKLPAIKKEITALVESVLQSVDTISNMNSESVPKALELFKSDLSLANAITYVNNYEQQKQAIIEQENARRAEEIENARLAEIERIKQEERNKIREEERIREEARNAVLAEIELKAAAERAEEEAKAQVEAERIAEEVEALSVNEEVHAGDPVIKSFFVIKGTSAELDQIELYLNSIGAEYERNDM